MDAAAAGLAVDNGPVWICCGDERWRQGGGLL